MAKFACSFFVTTVLILCTVTVICTATPVMRLGGNGSRRGSAEGLRASLSNASRERHRVANQYFGSHERSHWHNPCGGVFDPAGGEPQKPVRDPEVELEQFKNVNIRARQTIHTIEKVRGEDHKTLDRWAKWEPSYSFLPTLNHSDSSAQMSASVPHLKRRPQLWHRDLQVYVAAFQYLHKKQLPEVVEINNGTSPSEQLSQLLESARGLLCDIETLINATTGNLRKPRSRIEMGNILKYNVASNVNSPQHFQKFLDREFTKQKYYQYVSDLSGVLKRKIQRLSNPNRRNSSKNASKNRRKSNESGKRRHQRLSAEEDNLTRELRRRGRKQRRHRTTVPSLQT